MNTSANPVAAGSSSTSTATDSPTEGGTIASESSLLTETASESSTNPTDSMMLVDSETAGEPTKKRSPKQVAAELLATQRSCLIFDGNKTKMIVAMGRRHDIIETFDAQAGYLRHGETSLSSNTVTLSRFLDLVLPVDVKSIDFGKDGTMVYCMFHVAGKSSNSNFAAKNRYVFYKPSCENGGCFFTLTEGQKTSGHPAVAYAASEAIKNQKACVEERKKHGKSAHTAECTMTDGKTKTNLTVVPIMTVIPWANKHDKVKSYSQEKRDELFAELVTGEKAGPRPMTELQKRADDVETAMNKLRTHTTKAVRLLA